MFTTFRPEGMGENTLHLELVNCHGDVKVWARWNTSLKSFAELAGLLGDPRFGNAGQRNDDGVNICIALWCQGYKHYQIKQIVNALADPLCRPDNNKRMLEVVDRVLPYLESWGECGLEDAMSKCV